MLESLAASGAFDALEPNRARAFAAVEAMLSAAQRAHETAQQGQNELFGGMASHDKLPLPQCEAMAAGGSPAARI